MPRKNPFKLNVVSIRLVKNAPIYSERPIKDPIDAVDVVGHQLCEMDREVLCIINLKSNGLPINCHFVSIGTLNELIVTPREIFKTSILSNAANIILLHCHPSGSLDPSPEDAKLTDRMIKLCALMGIPLLDHIIVGGYNNRYFSFKEKRILTNPHCGDNRDYHTLDFEATIPI